MSSSKTFFSDEDHSAIEASIKKAESRTAGEIVAMVVDSSDRYADINVIVPLVAASAIAVYPAEAFYIKSSWLLHSFLPSVSWLSTAPDPVRFSAGLCMFVAVALAVYFPLKFVFSRIPAIKRFFVTDRRKNAEVRERAIQAFYDKGLHHTRDATGVLFLISLLERKVYVLADHGIYQKISQESLDQYAASVAKGVKEGKAAQALCEAIASVGDVLAAHFPIKPDDRNELPNSVQF